MARLIYDIGTDYPAVPPYEELMALWRSIRMRPSVCVTKEELAAVGQHVPMLIVRILKLEEKVEELEMEARVAGERDA